MVKAKALTTEHIVKALRTGQFYSSSGPNLETIYSDAEGNLRVRCSPVKFIRALSTVGRVAQVTAPQGETLCKADLKWDWSESPFVRVECVDEIGRTAWSQGVLRIEEKGQGN